jgi:hypothetical protein
VVLCLEGVARMDPLKPFTDLARTLSRTRGSPTARAHHSGQTKSVTFTAVDATRRVGSPDDLHARLRKRLKATGLADPSRAREAFVEVILAWELGDRLPHDQSLTDIVKTVSDRIDAHAHLSGRLHSLLAGLANG